MKDEKRILKLDKYEYGLVFDSVNDKRNELLRTNESTDFIDEVLIKIATAPTKNRRKDKEYER